MTQEEGAFPIIELDLGRPFKAPVPPPPKEQSLGERLRVLPESLEIIRLANRFAADPEKAMQIYNEDAFTLKGRLIGGDDLVGILPWVSKNPLLCHRFSGEALAALPLRMFRARMAMPLVSDDEWVLITMGMPACGKTTLVKGGMGNGFHTIVDSPLSSFDTARELRQMARQSGRKVAFVYAHRPLRDAVRGMLERALPWREGRTVSLENMGTTLVKGLALFLELARLNPTDEDTTLDLVEVVNGKRQWFSGAQAAQRVTTIRTEFAEMGESVLSRLIRHWLMALQEVRSEGIAVPELLVNLVQEDLAPHLLSLGGEPEVDTIQQVEPEAFDGSVKSLFEWPSMRSHLDRWLECADMHEAKLRNWRITGDGPRELPIQDPVAVRGSNSSHHDPDRSDFRSERGFQAWERLSSARGAVSMLAGIAGTSNMDRLGELLFWSLLQEDPLMEAWNHVPVEARAPLEQLEALPPNSRSADVMKERMDRLRKITALFMQNEEMVLNVLLKL